jgi:hypothetical protein
LFDPEPGNPFIKEFQAPGFLTGGIQFVNDIKKLKKAINLTAF